MEALHYEAQKSREVPADTKRRSKRKSELDPQGACTASHAIRHYSVQLPRTHCDSLGVLPVRSDFGNHHRSGQWTGCGGCLLTSYQRYLRDCSPGEVADPRTTCDFISASSQCRPTVPTLVNARKRFVSDKVQPGMGCPV